MIPDDFVKSLAAASREEIVAPLVSREQRIPGRVAQIVDIVNQIRPSDLFCYLGARFGPPNGFQNFLRGDTSDNLIHWEWTLRHSSGLVYFQGHNFCTEVHIVTSLQWEASDLNVLIGQIKLDFANHGKGMSEIRKRLEPWIEFVNPYQRLRRAVAKLSTELEALRLPSDIGIARDVQPRELFRLGDPAAQDAALREWQDVTSHYSKALGLCFGIRSMLPVMAEAFVNLLLYALMRPEIKRDDRLREHVIRQPIDVRIKSLGMQCLGFATQVDYSHPACAEYHSLVNERNDMLHGNVVIDNLKFNDVFFLGKVPVFREYRSMWQRALGAEIQVVGLERLEKEMQIVDGLVEYLLSCLDPKIQPQMRAIANAHELGLNTSNQRLGILFGQWLVDSYMGLDSRPGSQDAPNEHSKTAQQGAAADDRPQAGDRG